MLARMARIAIVGGGSIGEALLSGLLRAGRQVKDLVVAEKHPDRAKYLSDTYSVLVTTVADAVDTAAYVIVAVKPADVSSVVGEIADAAAKAESNTAEQVFVSVVAGMTTEFYENKLPAGSPVIRVMPNAPVVVGGGVSALARGRVAPPAHQKGGAAGIGWGDEVIVPAYTFGGDRSGRANDGRLGCDVAGAPGRGAACGRRGDGHRDGHHRGPIARHGYLAGRHYRCWAAGTRTRWFAGGGR